MTENKIIEQIYEKAHEEEYDNILVRDMADQLRIEIKEAIHERLISLGLRHLKEYDIIDDNYDHTYEKIIKEGKRKITIDIDKHLLHDVKLEHLEDGEWIENIWTKLNANMNKSRNKVGQIGPTFIF